MMMFAPMFEKITRHVTFYYFFFQHPDPGFHDIEQKLRAVLQRKFLDSTNLRKCIFWITNKIAIFGLPTNQIPDP